MAREEEEEVGREGEGGKTQQPQDSDSKELTPRSRAKVSFISTRPRRNQSEADTARALVRRFHTHINAESKEQSICTAH